jgi:prepilin-type N-terminal cleavage/methylation domain-containing protein
MIKKGFALIEIIVSIAISSVIGVVLFTILIQVQKSAQFVANDVSIGIQLMTGYERLQKDFTGMFWPQFVSAKVKPVQSKQLADIKKIANKLAQKTSEEQDQQLSPEIAKIIFSENTRFNELEILKECSFITCNPLQVYGETKPCIARIIYTLEPEGSNDSGSFILYRQEGLSLDYAHVKKESAKFALIAGIRACNLSYFYQDRKLISGQNQAPDLIEKQELELDQTNHLPQNDLQETAGLDLTGCVPSYVKLNLSLWTSLEQKDYQDFEFWFYINNLVVDYPVEG